MKKKSNKKKRGSALIFATIVLFATLMIVVTLSSVTVVETRMSQKTKSSTGAFFNADSGIEYAMNKITSGSGDIATVFSGYWSEANDKVLCPSGYDCEVYLLDASSNVITSGATQVSDVKSIRSVGTKDADTSRAIEAAVAQAAGAGCYTDYGLATGLPVGANCSISGFTIEGSLGNWGICCSDGACPPLSGRAASFGQSFRPPGGGCFAGHSSGDIGEAYLCCK